MYVSQEFTVHHYIICWPYEIHNHIQSMCFFNSRLLLNSMIVCSCSKIIISFLSFFKEESFYEYEFVFSTVQCSLETAGCLGSLTVMLSVNSWGIILLYWELCFYICCTEFFNLDIFWDIKSSLSFRMLFRKVISSRKFMFLDSHPACSIPVLISQPLLYLRLLPASL